MIEFIWTLFLLILTWFFQKWVVSIRPNGLKLHAICIVYLLIICAVTMYFMLAVGAWAAINKVYAAFALIATLPLGYGFGQEMSARIHIAVLEDELDAP